MNHFAIDLICLLRWIQNGDRYNNKQRHLILSILAMDDFDTTGTENYDFDNSLGTCAAEAVWEVR